MSVMGIDRSKNTRKVLTFPHELVREVEDFRYGARISTESEAFRELIRRGLRQVREEQTQKAPRKKGPGR